MRDSSQQNDPIVMAAAAMVKRLIKGIQALKNAFALVGFMLAVLAMLYGYSCRSSILKLESLLGQDVPMPIRYLFLAAVLLTPLFYLLLMESFGAGANNRYQRAFSDIGFVGRDGKYPQLVSESRRKSMTIYQFHSNIPISEWKKKQELLETGLDRSIRQISQGKNKKIVTLVTVDNSAAIPTHIAWDDNCILPEDGQIIVGENDLGKITFDLNKTPHVLAAGETGSGKSVILRCILWQMVRKGCRVYMIDFKGGVEFGKAYERFGEVITQRERALEVLQMLVAENAARLALFREMEVKNLKEYNDRTGKNLCRIGVFIDEIAEMLDKKGVSRQEKAIFEQLEGELSTLARLSRATGINLIFGVQRPDANILTGQIKNNIPVRISGRFADAPASEIVLGNNAACSLPNIKGRFLCRIGNEINEFQSYYFDDSRDLRLVRLHTGKMLTQPADEESNVIELPRQRQQPHQGTRKEVAAQNEVKSELNFDFD